MLLKIDFCFAKNNLTKIKKKSLPLKFEHHALTQNFIAAINCAALVNFVESYKQNPMPGP